MKHLSLLMLLFMLAACSGPSPRGGYYSDDGPSGSRPDDESSASDAVPRAEAYSKSGNKPYKALNRTYYPLASHKGYRERGVASWYGKKFHGRLTSSGERYDMHAMSAAHKTLPIPCYARVTNLRNGRSVVVRVNDRGPFLHNRLIDLSYAAAQRLGIAATGTGLVEVEAIDAGQLRQAEPVKTAKASSPDAQIFVQLGAFSERERAERERARLERSGLRPFVVKRAGFLSNVYRLRIGPLASIDESDEIVARAARNGVSDAHVVIE